MKKYVIWVNKFDDMTDDYLGVLTKDNRDEFFKQDFSSQKNFSLQIQKAKKYSSLAAAKKALLVDENFIQRFNIDDTFWIDEVCYNANGETTVEHTSNTRFRKFDFVGWQEEACFNFDYKTTQW